MSNIQLITPEMYSQKHWCRQEGYSFTSADPWCPLVAQELPMAMLSLPIAFVEAGDSYCPVALQSLEPGQNLIVAPDGRWLSRYIPAAYRAYPFLLAEGPDKQMFLGFDESSGSLSDNPDDNEFFTTEGELGERLGEIVTFLNALNENRELTNSICTSLQESELIQPWPLVLENGQSGKSISGLFRIDEEKLNLLSADVLASLRDQGALSAAYCQLLSMPRVQQIFDLEKTKDTAGKNDLGLELFSDNDNISFDNL